MPRKKALRVPTNSLPERNNHLSKAPSSKWFKGWNLRFLGSIVHSECLIEERKKDEKEREREREGMKRIKNEGKKIRRWGEKRSDRLPMDFWGVTISIHRGPSGVTRICPRRDICPSVSANRCTGPTRTFYRTIRSCLADAGQL